MLVVALVAAALAQDTLPPRWELELSAYAGIPGGWTAVRENAINGTHLDLRNDLNLTSRGWGVSIARRLSVRSALRLEVEDYQLDGAVTPALDVIYNGTTLVAGAPLETRTNFPYFVRGTLTYERSLGSPGGVRLTGTAGLTFVALTFKMRGTIAASSVGHETQEDFVTQELPVPMLGLRATYPRGRRFAAWGDVAGGFLPWVNSLRHEGGEVRLRQAHLDVRVRLAYALTDHLRVVTGYGYTGFAQHESSSEDGNDIALTQHALEVGLVRRW